MGPTSSNLQVLSMLKNISNVHHTLVERVETTESEIKSVKARLASSSNTSDSGVKRVDVPLAVQVELVTAKSLSIIIIILYENALSNLIELSCML